MKYYNKRAIFVGKHSELCFGQTGHAIADASTGKSNVHFVPDGGEKGILVSLKSIWTQEDGYSKGPPNYK